MRTPKFPPGSKVRVKMVGGLHEGKPGVVFTATTDHRLVPKIHGEYKPMEKNDRAVRFLDNTESVVPVGWLEPWDGNPERRRVRDNSGMDLTPSDYIANPRTRDIGQHVYDYRSAARFLERHPKGSLAHNTRIFFEQNSGYYGGAGAATIAVKLHGTVIVRYREDGMVELNSGGYRTVTTKQRINQLLPPGFSVEQKNFDWFLRSWKGGSIPFVDGMKFFPDKGLPSDTEDDSDDETSVEFRPSAETMAMHRALTGRKENPPRRHAMEAEPGSVSTGTLRAEDLLASFSSALTSLYEGAGKPIPRHIRKLLGDARRADTENEDPFNAEVVNGLIGDLMDELEHFAPDGYYFGAHPGDGADFGYWPVED